MSNVQNLGNSSWGERGDPHAGEVLCRMSQSIKISSRGNVAILERGTNTWCHSAGDLIPSWCSGAAASNPLLIVCACHRKRPKLPQNMTTRTRKQPLKTQEANITPSGCLLATCLFYPDGPPLITRPEGGCRNTGPDLDFFAGVSVVMAAALP